MVKNYIPENIEYLIQRENSSKDEFGFQFDLKRGIVSQYVRKISLPKLETIQRICLHYEISIDDFVNTDLSAGKPYGIKGSQIVSTQESNPDPYMVSPRYVEVLEKALEDKEKIIKSLELRLGDENKSETA
jgi:transcriptional regulator with XRE-family HTH domain